MGSQMSWLNTISQHPLPILTSTKALPKQNASYQQWTDCIQQDPLLALHLFKHTNQLLNPKKTQTKKLSHIISLLGTAKVNAIAEKLPHINKRDPRHLHLVQLVADAQVATSATAYFMQIRQLNFDEHDYWHSLFYRIGEWPLLLCNFKQWYRLDQQVQNVVSKNALVEQLTQIQHEKWHIQIGRFFAVQPAASSYESDLSTNSNQKTNEKLYFKQQILQYLLPNMHHLSYFARKTNTQQQLQLQLAQMSDRLEHDTFQSFFNSALANAARKIKNPYASYAIKQQFNPKQAQKLNETQSKQLSRTDAPFFKRLYAKIVKQTAEHSTQHQLIHDCLQACCLGLGFKEAAFFKVDRQQLICLEDQKGQIAVQKPQFQCSISSSKLLQQLCSHSQQITLLKNQVNNQPSDLPSGFVEQFDCSHIILLSICKEQHCLGLFYFHLPQREGLVEKKKQAFDIFMQKIAERFQGL